MKLNHLSLSVSDVLAARQFLETYFGLGYRFRRVVSVVAFGAWLLT